ncbi:MAG: S-layer homology domain-containing protein [Candidatus Peregrinibacteria bacterium]
MKKIFLLVMFFILMTSQAFAGSFPDVPQDHENYDAVEYLDSKEIIQGYEDGTFGPDNLLNRAEAMKLIINSFGIEISDSYKKKFPDVPETSWFFDYVMAGQDAGIINGYPDGTFRPADNVNMAEFLKMVMLAAKITLPDEVQSDIFVDVPMSAWYAPHAFYAREHNIILPDEYGYIHPEQPVARGDVAEIIYRTIIVNENDGDPYPLYTNWPYYDGTDIPFKMKYDSGKWEVIERSGEVVFLRRDSEFMQFSPARLYPNSAVVRVVLDSNDVEMDANQYFANIKLAFPGAQYTPFTIQGLKAFEVLYPEKRIVDWYMYLANDDVVAVYTEFGSGTLGYQLTRTIQAMLSTLGYNEIDYGKVDYSDLLSEIFANVLIEGKGEENLNKLPDKLIIETDAIGVGTGPIDYYYSSGVDYTFKYERASDTILDTRKGRTTAF